MVKNCSKPLLVIESAEEEKGGYIEEVRALDE